MFSFFKFNLQFSFYVYLTHQQFNLNFLKNDANKRGIAVWAVDPSTGVLVNTKVTKLSVLSPRQFS